MVIGIVISLITQGGVTKAASANLAPNPNIEGNPFCCFSTHGNAAFSWATDQSHSPTHSLKIVSTQGGLTRWISSRLSSTPGHVYHFSAWLKTSQAAPGAGHLAVNFWKGSKYSGTQTSSPSLSGTNDWTQVSLDFTAPSGFDQLRVEFRLTSPGTLWADDLSIIDQSIGPTPPDNTSIPTISGGTVAGQTLTAAPGTWSGSTPMTYNYKWYLCNSSGSGCFEIAGATDSSYTIPQSDQGSTLKVNVAAQNDAGQSSAFSAATAIINAAPLNTSLPVISGLRQDGQTLTATTGSWTGTPTPTYASQWQRCDNAGNNCLDIPGANALNYELKAADVNNKVKFIATATNSAGSGSATSALTDAIAAAPPVNSSLPVVSGTAQENQTLSVSNGSWNGTIPFTYGYQWQRCDINGDNCQSINGATSQLYTLSSTDVSNTVKATVTAANAAGSAAATSNATSVIEPAPTPPSNTQLPTVSGNPQDVSTLNASTGTWDGTAPISYAYQWQGCNSEITNCVDITGANSQSYQLVSADVGSRIRVVVTATNSVGSASASSDATVPIAGLPPSNVTKPTISGNYQETQTLTAEPGTWSGTTPLNYAYQWQSCDGENCTAISGAVDKTYTLLDQDIGKIIKILVTASNTAGSANATSDPSGTIAAAPDPPVNTGLPQVTGDTVDGSVLNTSNGGWTGTSPIGYEYQWQKCDSLGGNCLDVPGESSGIYTLKSADVGSTIRARVTAANIAGNAEAFSVNTSEVTAAPPVVVSDPVITGATETTRTLTAIDGSWTGTPPISFSYQWQRCQLLVCDYITGATAQSYTLTNDDFNYKISIEVTASNGGGSSQAYSAQTETITLYSPPLPKSIAALGDSLTRAYQAGGTESDAPAYSWSTGNNPVVYSQYMRVLARDGAISGKSANYAQSGSKMSATQTQANSAINFGAEFVTLFSGTNDVCTANTSQMTSVSNYRLQVRSTLTNLSTALPNSKILVVSIPDWFKLWQSFASNPDAQSAWQNFSNRCPVLMATSASSSDREAVRQRIIEFNGILSQECSALNECFYDSSAVYNLNFTGSDLAADYFHFSPSGQAKLSAALWAAGPYANSSQPENPNPPQATQEPSVSGSAQSGQTLSANGGIWASTAPYTLAYQWQKCSDLGSSCADIPSEITKYYTLIDTDIGYTFKIKVTATSEFGTSEALSQPSTVVMGISPANSSIPQISGAPEVGKLISVTDGDWSGTQPITYSYQWQGCDGTGNNCTDISGATTNQFTASVNERGSTLKARVTANNPYGGSAATSATTAVVTDPAATDKPLLTSFSEVKDSGCANCSAEFDPTNNTLTTTIGGGANSYDTAYGLTDFGGPSGWNARTYSRVDLSLPAGTAINGNIAVLQELDANSSLIYELWLMGGTRELCLYSPISWVNCSGVIIPNDGSPTRLEVSAQANDSFIIRINGVDKITRTNLSGATGAPRYLRVGIDHYDTSTTNETIRVLHTNPGITTLGWLADRTSAAYPPANGSLPQISGQASVGNTLSTTDGSWSGASTTTYSYQWQSCGSAGDNCADISGATTATYTLTDVDMNQTIRSKVTASNSYGQSSAYSAVSEVVSATPPTIAVKPIVKGQTKEGGYALVTDGEWNGSSPITYTYQWQKCDQYGNSCQDIAGASSNSYNLTSVDVGLTFGARVTATNIAGTATSLSNLSASITSSSVASYDFVRNIVSDTGGQCTGCATESIASGDINSDGKQDVVVGGKSALLWYENNGSGTSWTPHPIASGWFGDGSQIVVEDINGDGRKDVAAGQDSTVEKVVWFENSGTSWLAHDITTDIHCHDLVFADIDSDGQLDAACNDQLGNKIVWLREPSDPAGLWETRVIDNVGAMGAGWADIDKDGRPDLVAGRSWYKNPGDLLSPWPRYSYTTKTSGYGFDNYETISVIDLNQDGKLDIFATLFAESTGGKVWAFIAPDDPTTQSWAEVLVDSEPLFGVHSQVAVDFDGSGVPQIVVGESNYGGWDFGPNPDAQIYIYRLLGPATDPNSWQRTAVDAIGTHEAVAVDVNSDGRPDIVGHFENTDFMAPAQNGPVHWWKNNSN